MNERLVAFVERLINKFGTSNPFELAGHHNLETRYVPYLQNPLGQYVNIRGRRIILISENLTESNQRYFVAAHELYHALEHEGLAGYYVSAAVNRGKLEMEANTFATYLMMAFHLEETDSLPSGISELKRRYGVEEKMEDYLITDFDRRI